MSVENIKYEKIIEEKLKSSNFQDELYEFALDVALNRLESQQKKVTESQLLRNIQELFQTEKPKHLKSIRKAKEKAVSKACLLVVEIKRAEQLASKDVDGSSDPYCLVGVVPTSNCFNLKSGKVSCKKTRYVKSSLSPTWNETFELHLSRDLINDFSFQAQVWDYDGDEDTIKKVKGVKGITRFVKEAAQSVTSRNDGDLDDFMGFISIPLKDIPGDGLESFFNLKASHHLQNVTGRVKIKLTLTSASRSQTKCAHDVIYAAFLQKMVTKAHQEHLTEQVNSKRKFWNGALSRPADVFLRELEGQFRLPILNTAIARWEVYVLLHVQHRPGVDIRFMQELLIDLEDNALHAQKCNDNMRFNFETLCHSFKMFINEESTKIAVHRDVFSSDKTDCLIELGSVLRVLMKVSSLGIYGVIRAIDPSIPSDVRIPVIEALMNKTSEYYHSSYKKLHEEAQKTKSEKEETTEENEQYGDPEMKILIMLTEIFQKDLFDEMNYHQVFFETSNINYIKHVSDELWKNLARDVTQVMTKVNKTFQPTETDDSTIKDSKASSIFHLYMTLKNFIDAHMKNSEESNTKKLTLVLGSPMRSIDFLGKPSAETDVHKTISFHNYHEWFRPAVLHWLRMSRDRMKHVLVKAVEVDDMERVDEIVKHSSSAVDAVAYFIGVVDSWKNLKWPEPIDHYTIALRIADDVAWGITMYTDLIHKNLHQEGFFDIEGQFDVTEKLCVSLNNLEHVKTFLANLREKMAFQEIADAVESHPGGPSAERVLTNFSSLIATSEIGIKKQLQLVISAVGDKLKPYIERYLRQLSSVLDIPDVAYYKEHDEKLRKKLNVELDKAIKPLMVYLQSNVIFLQGWLCKPNFRRILEVLWSIAVQSLRKTVLVDFVNERPDFFYQCRRAYSVHFIEFFHAEGFGIPVSVLGSKSNQLLSSELKMRSATNTDLMRLFYLQMYEEQQKTATHPSFGVLNVFAMYNASEETLYIDVISAEQLRPLDINGLSDPFVQLRLAPFPVFPEQEVLETEVRKKTLDPLWENSSFSFKLEKSLATEDGNVVIFTVLDHDVITLNDLEGEAVLPLSLVDGVCTDGKGKRNFKLTLTQPTKESQTSLKYQPMKSKNADAVQLSKEVMESVRTELSNVNLDNGDLSYEDSLTVHPLTVLKLRASFDKQAKNFCLLRSKVEKYLEPQFRGKKIF